MVLMVSYDDKSRQRFRNVIIMLLKLMSAEFQPYIFHRSGRAKPIGRIIIPLSIRQLVENFLVELVAQNDKIL